MNKRKVGLYALLALGIGAVVMLILSPPIPQDPAYHNFSDHLTIFGIPSFWNVVSNLPFLVVGFLGLKNVGRIAEKKAQYVFLFTGILLIAFGSGYYHMYPSDETLVWDRLPMTVMFMALFSIVISEFMNDKRGKQLLYPLLILGILSIVLWIVFDDLRFYAMVQFYPLVAIPIMLLFFRSSYSKPNTYWLLLGAYLIAKVLEHFDHQVHEFTVVQSGHTLKHYFAGLGLYLLYRGYVSRKKLVT